VADERVAAPLAGNRLAPAGTELVVVEWRAEADGGDPPLYIAPLHVHRSDDEAWYVLEGTLAFRLGDEELEVEAGGAVMAPREHGPHLLEPPARAGALPARDDAAHQQSDRGVA